MNPDKAVADFITWCRAEAAKYTELAETVEAKLRANGTAPLPLSPSVRREPVKDELVLSIVKNALADKQRRMKNLIALTGATKRQLEKLLTAENGIAVKERGWFDLLQQEEENDK